MAMILRLSPDDEVALALLAETEGISKQEATVRAIHEAAERHGHSAAVESASRLGQCAVRRSLGAPGPVTA